eukprot:3189741-Rhodomonas_salina.2
MLTRLSGGCAQACHGRLSAHDRGGRRQCLGDEDAEVSLGFALSRSQVQHHTLSARVAAQECICRVRCYFQRRMPYTMSGRVRRYQR